ncbi:BREX-1 system adenine-specific DNA-methyltransferase PglX [Schleiferilactobacillus harbinensis]|uniref:BREX-1 system adenine-specific DNA-methyltransferase PglX n=1 Tax=Schleiferilactobacillus harbinensis TaxID=304207 RepID=UPI0021A758C7|nr:BREX-1 system adenine-specific DNA-methyltransferase PglX [Schleiferilactobacillus harbinensis]MCT2907928.1 BREX-1 system adenine-specific DNA-methyltransferase PglX [Schleiferilactobacillus harbinensis]
MDKKKIHDFAVKARRELIESVELKLTQVGITRDGVKEKLPTSTAEIAFYVPNYTEGVSGRDTSRRVSLVQRLQTAAAKDDWHTAYDNLVEEASYTWFNRIIALRFMEVNHYLPSRVAVLSSEEGRAEPDILAHALEIEDDLGGFSDEQRDLIQHAQETQEPAAMDNAYRLLFLKQANALNANLPHLFEKTTDALQLLFTPSYQNGVIKELVTEVPRDDFDVEKEGQVEIIGWLYQYYNEVPKNAAVAQPKSHKYGDQELASATQLFTPDWIVKYMVQNSLGKLWIHALMTRHPEENETELVAKFNWQYYMPDAPQTAETVVNIQKADQELANLQPQDISFLDPSMGSGHILVYAFDVLMAIYTAEGYGEREAAGQIVKHNLQGLDIDARAQQLAYFAVMMKLRQFDRRALSRNISPEVYDIPSSTEVSKGSVELLMDDFTKEEAQEIYDLMAAFQNGREVGSLVDTSKLSLETLQHIVEKIDQGAYNQTFVRVGEKIHQLIQIALILSEQHDIIVTNPPYLGTARLNNSYSKFLKQHYPNAKADLFAAFLEKFTGNLKRGGYSALVTMQSWMFLSSFEKLRKGLLAKYTLSNLMHMENGVMGIAFGTAVSIFRNMPLSSFNGTYHQIKYHDVQNGDPASLPVAGNRYNRTNQANFEKISGNPISYWIPKTAVEILNNTKSIASAWQSGGRLKTHNNLKFLRFWWEILLGDGRWKPIEDGGSFRRWAGNDYIVVDYSPAAISAYREKGGLPNQKLIDKQGITWNLITSADNAFRIKREGNAYSSAAPTIISIDDVDISDNTTVLSLLGQLNSKSTAYILEGLNPTLNTTIHDVTRLPLFKSSNQIALIVTENLSISSADWSESETAGSFLTFSLVTNIAEHNRNWTVEAAFNQWKQEAQDRFDQLKKNEEELNKIFIDLYGLQDELSPEESDKEVSVRKADLGRDIRAFMSYFIGVTFGRYSLDTPGLAFAGGDWDASKYTSYQPNADDVIVLTDSDYFGDDRDIMHRFREFLTVTFGKEHLEENITFIAKALGKAGDTAEDQIRSYLFNDFYKNHLTIYQKRPIYWQLDSGRHGGFKALMYLHRYDGDTMAMIRTSYLHTLQAAYEKWVTTLDTFITSETNTRQKNQLIKQRDHTRKQLEELVKYDAQLQHVANMHVAIDLDDGVVVNHQKVQADVKLLTPIK